MFKYNYWLMTPKSFVFPTRKAKFHHTVFSADNVRLICTQNIRTSPYYYPGIVVQKNKKPQIFGRQCRFRNFNRVFSWRDVCVCPRCYNDGGTSGGGNVIAAAMMSYNDRRVAAADGRLTVATAITTTTTRLAGGVGVRPPRPWVDQIELIRRVTTVTKYHTAIRVYGRRVRYIYKRPYGFVVTNARDTRVRFPKTIISSACSRGAVGMVGGREAKVTWKIPGRVR